MVELLYRDQSFDLRERESFIQTCTREQGVYLQTCNRVEIYRGTGSVPQWITEHLFSVVSGIKSSFLGENAIQGQVKKAYLQAQAEYKLSSSIHRLFQKALYVGKKVRRDTDIGKGAVSHSLALIRYLNQNVPDLDKKELL